MKRFETDAFLQYQELQRQGEWIDPAIQQLEHWDVFT